MNSEPDSKARRVEPTRRLFDPDPRTRLHYIAREKTDVTVTWRRAIVAQQMLKDYRDPWETNDE